MANERKKFMGKLHHLPFVKFSDISLYKKKIEKKQSGEI